MGILTNRFSDTSGSTDVYLKLFRVWYFLFFILFRFSVYFLSYCGSSHVVFPDFNMAV
jgi:hypothetical protein